MLSLVVLAALLVCACSSETGHTSGPTGPCVARSGSYLKHVERAGAETTTDCGAGADAILTLSSAAQATEQSKCKDSSTVSADNCKVTADETWYPLHETASFRG